MNSLKSITKFKTKSLSLSALLFICLLVCPYLAQSSGEVGSVVAAGRVVDQLSQPIPAAAVHIQVGYAVRTNSPAVDTNSDDPGSGAKSVLTAQTDPAGNFNIALPADTTVWRVLSINKPAHRFDRGQNPKSIPVETAASSETSPVF